MGSNEIEILKDAFKENSGGWECDGESIHIVTGGVESFSKGTTVEWNEEFLCECGIKDYGESF